MIFSEVGLLGLNSIFGSKKAPFFSIVDRLAHKNSFLDLSTVSESHSVSLYLSHTKTLNNSFFKNKMVRTPTPHHSTATSHVSFVPHLFVFPISHSHTDSHLTFSHNLALPFFLILALHVFQNHFVS